MPTPFVDNVLNGQLTQASQPNQYGEPIQALESGQAFYQVATGVTNAYEVLFPPPRVVGAYTPGLLVNFLAHAVNTQAATLKVNGLPPKPITKKGGNALEGGEISANQVVSVIYDGTQFQLVGSEGGGVTSFIGRTGAVVPEPGDYDLASLDGVASATQGGTGHDEYESGDLLVAADASSLEPLAQGAEGQILTADGSQPLGLNWAAPPPIAPPPYFRFAYSVDVPEAVYGTYSLTVCADSEPPVLAVIGLVHEPPPRDGKVYFFYRMNNRWRPVPQAGIGVETVGAAFYKVKGPVNTNPNRMLYVPAGGPGPGRGRFWISSETNEYIRVVNPANLTYDDFPLDAADAVVGPMVLSADGEHVFAISGNGTRVIRINTSTVTVEATNSGWTNLTNLCVQTDGGVTGRVWVTRTGTGNDVLQWLDASTLVPTNTGWNPTYTLGPLVYLPELETLFVSAQNDEKPFSLVQANAPYTALLTDDVDSFGMRAIRVAYLPQVGMVARPDRVFPVGIDRATGTIVSRNRAGDLLSDVLYEPTFREFYVGGGNRPAGGQFIVGI